MKQFFKLVKKLSKTKKILLSIFVGILLLMICGVIYSRYLFSEADKQIPDLERTLDKFIIYQANGEYKKSYDLFTEETRNSEDLEVFIKKSSYIIRPAVDHYMKNSLYKDDFVINFFVGQPIMLVYRGYILYENREHGLVNASFILKNNKWELYGIQVTAHQSRLDQYSPPQEKPTP